MALKLWEKMRARLRRGTAPRRNVVALRPPNASAPDQTAIVAEGPLPLAEMYVDLLRGQGVPAMLRSSGAGRGALGGALVAAQVLVPADSLARAREMLGTDEAD